MKPIPIVDLEPQWLKYLDLSTRQRDDELSPATADGMIFLCPKCLEDLGGRPGVHSIVCWFEGRVPAECQPGPGRWTPSGTSFEDLTFIPGPTIKAVSIALIGGCAWHGFLRNGIASD